jgi:hypothetical protein
MRGNEAIRLFSIKPAYIVKISFAGPRGSGSDRARLQPASPAVAGFVLLLIGRLTPRTRAGESVLAAVVLVVLGLRWIPARIKRGVIGAKEQSAHDPHTLVFRSTQ